jgi:hypothetical protein
MITDDLLQTLIVGDPHIRAEDLLQGQKLLELLLQTPDAGRINLIFLGDLFHTHSLVHLQVQAFWMDAMTQLLAAFRSVTVIMGNHDAPHDTPAGINALRPLAGLGVKVVDRPQESGPFLMLPFYRSQADFVAAARASALKTVICHQTFNGSRFENGFFAPEGVDPDAIPQEFVVSGHIHHGQEFGKVWYPGAPRALTANDANKERFIWLATWSPDGKLLSRTPVKTEGYLARILQVEDSPSLPQTPADVKVYPGDQLTVVISGDQARVQERQRLWTGVAKIRTQVDQAQKQDLRPSEGMMPALQRFLPQFQSRNGTPGDVLFREISKRVGIFAQ